MPLSSMSSGYHTVVVAVYSTRQVTGLQPEVGDESPGVDEEDEV